METAKSSAIAGPNCDTAGYMDMDSETTDSGVHSDSTDMNTSMVISGAGLDDFPVEERRDIHNSNYDVPQLTSSDIENSNIPEKSGDEPEKDEELEQPPFDDAMISSQCSTFDSNDTAVCRRRPKRTTSHPPKKRVSFHEDILKNTKTDNIHIEHGFITYKNGVPQQTAGAAALAGRYSWCPKGTHQGEFQVSAEDPDYVIYRNACSEVLDYGKTDIYDGDGEPPKCDNSGVFEYSADSQNGNKAPVENESLYQCNCSGSNSSLESNEIDVNSNQVRGNYAQTKSHSCECIGSRPQTEPELTDNCYYSEPNIDTMRGVSVWRKETQPKSSCLKKTKYSSFESYHMSQDAVAAKLSAVKRYNMHSQKNSSAAVASVTNLLDNGKSIFGSLKNIFGIPLPERGVPEGQEDAQAVHETEEYVAEPLHSSGPSPVQASPGSKSRSFLSKSFDAGLHEKLSSPNKKTFMHTVDEQLRKKTGGDAQERGSPKRTAVARSLGTATTETPSVAAAAAAAQPKPEVYRNKFIVNCESTVFEHTGVSYCYEGAPTFLTDEQLPQQAENVASTSHSYLTQKISKWTNMFRSSATPNTTKEATKTTTTITSQPPLIPSPTAMQRAPEDGEQRGSANVMECSIASSNSTMTDVSSIVSTPTTATASSDPPTTTTTSESFDGFSKIFGGEPSSSSPRHESNRTPTRHLPSPRRRQYASKHHHHQSRMSPDLFNNYMQVLCSGAAADQRTGSSLASDYFDDILTVTTSSSSSVAAMERQQQEDLVIVDYPEITIPDHPDDSDFLKPASSKSSLINRFLRNVTQKKMVEATVALNRKLVAAGGRDVGMGVVPGRPVARPLYIRNVRPMSRDLIEDLNAEIAMEIEQSRPAVERRGDRQMIEKTATSDFETENGFGVGELPLKLFQSMQFPFIGTLVTEFLMKVFKLYIGYDREGIMTPVLVFLTNKTLYVTDLVRSTLCNKFVMPYADLDVILLGPHGNTVLLCNGDRDMQQVLLAGGPNQANLLVSSLEICARRGGLQLPSIGQLTLDHLAPLQHFVRDNSKTVDRRQKWLYYAVVSISPMTTAGGLTEVQEQLGANTNGPLMHRSVNKAGLPVSQWSASYFLLKAGVLYMFPTTTSAAAHSSQRLPSWALTLTECQGVRRMMNAGRPHCFELLLRTGALQLAGSDEYAASDWMQALVQSASGLFELEEKRSHYGCTLVLTSSHIITLRENFAWPLTRNASQKEGVSNGSGMIGDDGSSRTSSTVSTPSRTVSGGSGGAMRKRSGGGGGEAAVTNSISTQIKGETGRSGGGSYGKMCSEYGRGSGMEILSCADVGELISVKVSQRSSVWWCLLEFSCQECVQENSDVVVHFATESEHERFLATLQQVWRAKTKERDVEFPLQRLGEAEDTLAEHCTKLFTEINRMWDPLVAAALGYPK